MKKYILPIVPICLLLLSFAISCRKDNSNEAINLTPKNTDTLSLAQVKDWYAQNVNNTSNNRPVNNATKSFNLSSLSFDWNKASNIRTGKQNYWVVALAGQPAYRNAKQGYRKLAFFRDSTGNIRARILEIIPDVAYLHQHHGADTKTFTGLIFFYDQYYHLLNGKVFNNGKQVGQISPKTTTNNTTAAATTQSATNPMARNDVAMIQTCSWVDDNYIDADGVVTIYSYQVCSYSIDDDGSDIGGGGTTSGDPLGSGGGGGGSEGTAPTPAALPGQTNQAIDPKKYMNCFGGLPDIGSKETITVYVEEPQPGLPFNYGTNSVGHTAISLSKTYNGQTITQTVGFYPANSKLAATGTTAKVVDNTNLTYDVSITYQVEPFEFNAIANFIANPPATYNLYTYNCTNFVYDACSKGDITLPDPEGNVGMFQTGMTPAALGSSISDLTGQDGVNTTGGVTGTSHGPCN